MKPVSSLKISFGAEPFFAETETLILMNLNIGTFGYCIFIQKVLENLNILVLFSFFIDLTVFSFGIGFRPKP